ncbi:MAG: metal ABC transporter permease, partial [Micrococcaceae bacterium]
ASYVAKSPLSVFALSILLGVIASVGGVLLSLGSRIPVSPYITCLSFLLFVICRTIGYLRERKVTLKQTAPESSTSII